MIQGNRPKKYEILCGNKYFFHCKEEILMPGFVLMDTKLLIESRASIYNYFSLTLSQF